METASRTIYLINGYLAGKLTLAELVELDNWKAARQQNLDLFNSLTDVRANKAELDSWDISETQAALQRVKLRLVEKSKGFRWIAYAAATFAVLASLGLWLYFQSVNFKQKAFETSANISVAAGKERATLTLSDGRKIALEDMLVGTLAQQHGIKVIKTPNGHLLYEVSSSPLAGQIRYNTITTPKGGEFKMRLPDGSMVWLNAASSLTYATNAANAKERSVQLSGEAYFEVAKDASRPFVVQTPTQTVRVLGTHFNVNAYNDNGRTITTLQEGSVQVSTSVSNAIPVRLAPGEQAINNTGKLSVQPADIVAVLAWKEGNIQFKQAPLKDIMNMIGRWYDLEVHYEGNVADRVFTGKIPRSSNLSVLLKVFEQSQISFVLQESGNKRILIVKP